MLKVVAKAEGGQKHRLAWGYGILAGWIDSAGHISRLLALSNGKKECLLNAGLRGLMVGLWSAKDPSSRSRGLCVILIGLGGHYSPCFLGKISKPAYPGSIRPEVNFLRRGSCDAGVRSGVILLE